MVIGNPIVLNSISSIDNGKVVINGQLVSQTSLNITSNDTYDTTSYNQVVVNIVLQSANGNSF